MKKEDILQDCIDYFNGDEMAANVWIDKYALKMKQAGIVERTPDDMHHRLAAEFARIEANYPNPLAEKEIYDLLKGFKYVVPQGSPMTGVGSDMFISLSNCFVIEGAEDSYGGILQTDQEQLQLMKRRGGVGHDLSKLRPSGAMANNSVLTSTAGSILYAQRFSNSTKEVRQGDRRGAVMLSMSIVHPDIDKFIDSKTIDGRLTDVNISVRVTDNFMECVKNDTDFYQYFPIDIASETITHEFPGEENPPYDALIQGCSVSNIYMKRVRARKIWDKIVANAHKSAEPGVLFWDTILRESPADCYEGFETKGTNPCAEIPLCSYDSCRLMAMNLYSYVLDPFRNGSSFDLGIFRKHVHMAQRLMDDLVDLELEKINNILAKIYCDPEPDDLKQVEINLWRKIYDKTSQGRRTGLGITGEADMLAALGFAYGSRLAVKTSKEVHQAMAVSSYQSSIILAEERGHFKMFSPVTEEANPFICRILDALPKEAQGKYYSFGRRNISNLTIAPAGTVSIMTQTSSGIEPVFAISYTRRRRCTDPCRIDFTSTTGETFEEYRVFHHKFAEWYDHNWFKTDGRLYDMDFKKPLDMYSEAELTLLISKSPYAGSCAHELAWDQKIKMQSAIQKWVDHAISSTTNLAADIEVEDVGKVYMAAYESGCKGITVYREGSRSGILVSSQGDKISGLEYIDAAKRSKTLEADIYHKTIKGEDWMVVVGMLDHKPYEIFAFPGVVNSDFPSTISKGMITKEKSGVYKVESALGSKTYIIENMVDLLSPADGTSTRKFSLMLRHHVDPKFIIKDIEQYATITSFDKAIQRVLKNYVTPEDMVCPECGYKANFSEGCVKCNNCGWSKCS